MWGRVFLNPSLRTWFLSIIQDEFRVGKIDLDSAMKLLTKMQIPFDYMHVKHVFKVRSTWTKEADRFRSQATQVSYDFGK